MQLTTEISATGITTVRLSGRMDILGAQSIDAKFTAITATQKALVLVDMTDVPFLASLGMRTLIGSAKALSKRGGHMVVFNPQPNVLDVLQVSGLAQLIHVHADRHDAERELLGHKSV